MSYAQWNPTAYYLTGDIVEELGIRYQATADNTNSQPPSANWSAIVYGDITDVIAGTGLSGGGSSGAVTIANAGIISASAGSGISTSGTNPLQITNTGIISASAGSGISTSGTNPLQITNTGVLSLDSQTGAITTKSGQYYKTALQTLTSGNTDVTFNTAQSWSDATAISWTPGSQNFTVVTKGLYQMEFAATIIANGATWTTTSNKGVSLDITRSPIAEQTIVVNQALIASGVNYAQMVTGTLALEPGDVINCRVANTFAGGPAYVQFLQNTFDYNTTFTWTLLKPL